MIHMFVKNATQDFKKIYILNMLAKKKKKVLNFDDVVKKVKILK